MSFCQKCGDELTPLQLAGASDHFCRPQFYRMQQEILAAMNKPNMVTDEMAARAIRVLLGTADGAIWPGFDKSTTAYQMKIMRAAIEAAMGER